MCSRLSCRCSGLNLANTARYNNGYLLNRQAYRTLEPTAPCSAGSSIEDAAAVVSDGVGQIEFTAPAPAVVVADDPFGETAGLEQRAPSVDAGTAACKGKVLRVKDGASPDSGVTMNPDFHAKFWGTSRGSAMPSSAAEHLSAISNTASKLVTSADAEERLHCHCM